VAETTTTTVQAPRDESTEVTQPPSRRKGIIIAVVAVLVLAGLGFYWHSTYYEDTDDAQINGHLIQISSRIAGQVAKVSVDENQQVKAGQVIAELDPRDYQVAVENAKAALASAEAAAIAASVNVPITTINTGSNLSSAGADVSAATASISQAQSQAAAAHAQVIQAEANALKAQQDLARYKPLVEKDVISKQQYDAAVASADAAKAAFNITLHRLRKLLVQSDAIEVKDGTLQLNAEMCWVDAMAFQDLLHSSPSRAQTEAALTLYRGNLLPEDEDEPWSNYLREKLRRKFLHEVERVGEQLEQEADVSGPAQLEQQKRELDALTASFKQISAAVVPLGEQLILFNLYKDNLARWRASVRGTPWYFSAVL